MTSCCAIQKCAAAFEQDTDAVVFRNTGSVIGFQKIYRDFVRRVREHHIRTFNSFDGKADMRGKQYLLDLTRRDTRSFRRWTHAGQKQENS